MATLRTLCAAYGSGLKCVQLKMNTSALVKTLNAVCFNVVRHGSFKASPAVGDPSLYTKFEISRSPQEWKFVERLMPLPLVPQPPPRSEYPSGYIPQKEPAPDAPYFVRRSRNHMLPVYLHRSGPRKERMFTRVRYVLGDIWALEKDIRDHLRKSLPPNKIITSCVNEMSCGINFNGDHVNLVKQFLISKGL